VAVAVLGLTFAHAGLYLLLSAGAREGLDRIENRRGGPPRAASDPGPPPGEDSREFARWNEDYDLWMDGREHERHARHRGLLLGGLSFSLAVQLGIAGWLVLKHQRRARRARG